MRDTNHNLIYPINPSDSAFKTFRFKFIRHYLSIMYLNPVAIILFHTPKRFFLLFLISFIIIQNSYSQFESFSQDWRWVHFTTETGLPSNQIFNVTETRDGTAWAATSLGIARFDGYQWHAISDTAPLFNKAPQSIIAGNDSTIYAVFDFQIYICSSRGFVPLPLKYDGNKLEAIALAFTKQFGLLIQCSDRNLYTLRNTQLERFSMPAEFSQYSGPQLFSNGVGGTFWVSTVKGLYRWTGSQWDLKFPLKNNFFPIRSFIEQKDGTVFVSFAPLEIRGLWQLDPSGTIHRIESEGKEIIRTTDNSPSGEIIAVYESGDIRTYRNGSWAPMFSVPTQLRSALFLKFRPNGDLWVGTETGLYLHKSSSERWAYWIHPFPNLFNTVHAILKTRDGSIWLGTENGIEIHRSNNSVEDISSINGKSVKNVTGLCEDKLGDVWASSGGNFDGAYRWNGKRWNFFGPKEGLVGQFHRIKKDSFERLWFLGLGETMEGPQPGALMFDGNKFIRWGKKEGLLDDRVYSFASTIDGTFWFGTLTGISRLKKGVWRYWKSDTDLSGPAIFTLALDQNGVLWFGDRAHGLGYIDTLDNPHYLTQSDGLVDNSVWDINFDDRGTLWIATRGGVARYSSGLWSTFSLSSGLNSLKIWPILPVGEKVYIGTDGNGVDILSSAESLHPPPKLNCQDPAIDGDRATFHWNCFAYWGEVPPGVIQTRYRVDNRSWSSWNTQRELTLTGLGIGDHVLHIQSKNLFGSFDSIGQKKKFSILPPFYARLSFALPIVILSIVILYLGVTIFTRKRKHTHALRESETQLRMITDTTASAIFIVCENRIRFVNPVMTTMTGYTHAELINLDFQDLIHPSQQDHLQSIRMESSIGADTPVKIELRIVRKDGEERWLDCVARDVVYRGAKSLLVSAFDITDRKIAEAKLLAYQDQLRSLASELSTTEERERRQMASYLHDTIAQELTFSLIKLETLMDSVTPSHLDAELAEIHRFLSNSINNTQSLTFDLSPPILYELSLEDALSSLANQMQERHKLAVMFYDDGQTKPLSDELKIVLFHAVRELLTNVVKHAHATSVQLTISRSGEVLSIILEDDGRGFSTDILGPGGEKSHRFGIFHTRERLKSVGGAFEIRSTPGHGTHVSLSAPLSLISGEPT